MRLSRGTATGPHRAAQPGTHALVDRVASSLQIAAAKSNRFSSSARLHGGSGYCLSLIVARLSTPGSASSSRSRRGFLVRWPKDYQLVDAQGRERNAWQIARGKKTWERGEVWDGRRHHRRSVGMLALPVKHPAYDHPLWLVVSRPGKGQTPWYLVTNEPIRTAAAAWRLIWAYGRRWETLTDLALQ